MPGPGTGQPACLPLLTCLRKSHFQHLDSLPCLEGAQGTEWEGSQGPQGTSDRSVLPTPRGPRHREWPLATMQRGDDEDAVLVLKLVVQQFPVGIVNQHLRIPACRDE